VQTWRKDTLEEPMRSRPSVRRLAASVAITIAVAGAAATAGAVPAEPGFEGLTATPLVPESVIDAVKAGDRDRVPVILLLENDPVATYEGDVPGLAPTSPRVTGRPTIDPAATEVRRYRSFLRGRQDAAVTATRAAIPAAVETGRLDILVNAVSMVVPSAEVEDLATVPGVEAVLLDELLQPDTYGSVDFIGAPAAWDASGGVGSAGEGVVVGVLDSGVWPENPAFSDPDPSGKGYDVPESWRGEVCDFGNAFNAADAEFDCNGKLLGAQRLMAAYDALVGISPVEFRSARDDDGHGTHTASTAVGNSGVRAQVLNADELITGVAPRAHLAVYKVCGELGCFSSDSATAVQQAVLDGVDVINFSISGGANPYQDIVALSFLGAYEAGVFVAASAGNSGPVPNTVNHRAPWVMTVAASTSNRSFSSTATLVGGDATLTLTGASITAGIDEPAPISRKPGDSLCLTPAAAGTLEGLIVICDRGVNARVDKSANVAAGGAVGMFLVDLTPLGTNADAHSIPSVHFDSTEGGRLTAFVTEHPDATATFTGGAPTDAQGDVMAGFSSRGGSGQSLGISKPDITAPGVDILAASTELAYGQPTAGFAFLSGTSMSGPHLAGAGALLAALHPEWTPGQIKSAMMTTASTEGLVKEDRVTPFTPFDAGSGRVDLTRAIDPGITIAATGPEFTQRERDLWNANYPSVYVPVMGGQITVERTLRSVLGTPTNWTTSVSGPNDVSVSVPSSIRVPAGGSATLRISVDAASLPIGAVRHATISLRAGDRHLARIPVTIVRSEPAVTVAQECAPTDIVRLQASSCTVSLQNTGTDVAPVSLVTRLSSTVRLDPGSVTGAEPVGNEVRFAGDLDGRTTPDVAVAPGAAPFGYLPLSNFGIAPIAGVGDETIANFTVPAFTYGGVAYTRIGMVSNGYLVVGGGTGADVQFVNQDLPDPARPNNVLAPFWTDLDPSRGGALRIATLSSGSNSWIVLEWAAVPNWSNTAQVNSFQVWIKTGSAEPIYFAYGPVSGGDGGFLTVGAENSDGSRGGNVYVDGTGTIPAPGSGVVVTSTPGEPAPVKTITFDVLGRTPGTWTSRAELSSPVLAGTAVAVVQGVVRAR
jgi:subtilisin family serine protease